MHHNSHDPIQLAIKSSCQEPNAVPAPAFSDISAMPLIWWTISPKLEWEYIWMSEF